MKNKSIWSNELKNTYPKLDTNLDIDVLIIGGGMTGVNVSYNLINSGLSVCLVEKSVLGSGVSSKTIGKLTYLQENIFSKIKFYYGSKVASKYINSQKEAIEIIKQIIARENIKCNLDRVRSYIYSNNVTFKLKRERRLLRSAGINTLSATHLPDGEKTNSFYVLDTYVFNPLKYINAIAKICSDRGISIYENTKVESMEFVNNSYICHVNGHIIRAKFVVLAVHYPWFIKPFFLPFKAYLEKSYIGAYQVNNDYHFSAITVDFPSTSMRYYTDNGISYKLLLNNSHDLAIKNNEKKNFQSLLNKNKSYTYLWSNKDLMTIDSLPFIGKISDNLLIGTGYNTWGMTNSVLSGKVLSDIILGRDNEYIDLFNPKRRISLLASFNFFKSLLGSGYMFISTKIKKQKDWYSKRVTFKKINGKEVGIFVDEDNISHIVYNKCPHLKCSLIFNEVEKTWDCPCHGSRFDIDGKCIEGPSNYNIGYKGDVK